MSKVSRVRQFFIKSRRRNYLFFFIAVAGLLWVLTSCAWITPVFDEETWREQVMATKTADLYAPNYDGETFFNPWMPMEKKGFTTLLQWRLSSKQDYTDQEELYLPEVLPSPIERIRAAGDADFIFWVGHGTFFMRINGQYWLTDPMFSDRALLPKRKTPPGISIDEIVSIADRINCVISHNHYDHLDEKSVSALPDDTRFFVPLGMKDAIVEMGKTDVVEMNWWQSIDLDDGTRLVCTPMQHWSRRIGQGFNSVLWASFLIVSPDTSIYFDGDGGYFIGYKEVGRLFPGIDYALIPITAYHPRWFMHYAHMDVNEAIAAFDDLGASVFIPTQWGTFKLGDNPAGHPGLDLRQTITERKLDPQRFLILDIGGLHLID